MRVGRITWRGHPWEVSVTWIFAWYDLWVGAFWHRPSWVVGPEGTYWAAKLYLLPVPMLGLVFEFRKRPRDLPFLEL